MRLHFVEQIVEKLKELGVFKWLIFERLYEK